MKREEKEEKNNNTTFIMTIVLLSVLFCPMCFIFGIKLALSEDKGPSSEITQDENNKKNGNSNSNEDKVAYKDDYFEVKYLPSEENKGAVDVKINEKIIQKNSCTAGGNPQVINNKYIILELGCDSISKYIYDRKGLPAFTEEDYTETGLNYEEGILTIYYQNSEIRYTPDYEGTLCKNKDTSKIALKTIKYDMINGETKLSIKEDTINDVLKNRYNVTCEELKISKDPKLAYQKDLATN